MEVHSQLACPSCGQLTVRCSSDLVVESPVSTIREWVVYFTHECSDPTCGFRKEADKCIASLSDSTDPMTEWGYAHKNTPSADDKRVPCPMCGRRHGT
jgi:hypothetical protein